MTDAASSESPEKTISRGVVSIYKDHLGRGPTSARTTIADDHVSVICSDCLTKAERNLVANGDAEIVHLIRRKFQDAMKPAVIALVEQVSSREAETMLSDHDVDHDIAIETVVFVAR